QTLRLLGRVRRGEAGVEHVEVDVEVDQVGLGGQTPGGGGERRVVPGYRHVGRVDEALLVRVEVAHVDHHDPVGGQGDLLPGEQAPGGVAEPRADRDRHAAEHPAEGRARGVEVAVGVEPDQPDARAGTVRLLEPADDAREV